MRPMRKSSEGPEVVPDLQYQSPDKYLVPLSDRLRPSTIFQQKQSDGQEPAPLPPPQIFIPPHKGYDPLPYITEDKSRHSRSCGVFTTLLLVLIAFLAGGGVAGGVGGAMVVKKQAKISSLESAIATAPTVTVTAPSSTPTTGYLDAAGCPLIQNRTYVSTSAPTYSYLQLCNTEITTTGTANIDISTSPQRTWQACLDACTNYNQNVQQDGCKGASWILFSPLDPTTNLNCYLKSAIGNQTLANGTTGLQVVSGILQ